MQAEGLAVTGFGQVVLGEGDGDPTPFLKSRKSRKFMGRQDDLAVVAAGQALRLAGCAGGERVGLYLAVGYIPFEEGDIAPVLAGSLDEQGHFSPRKFGDEGLHRAHPLLTFRCLPNMPAFHVSVNFDVQGPYAVMYPGPGQLYLALEEAAAALADRRADAALLLGVAHQRNFLVEHHFGRLRSPVAPERLGDAAGCLLLERPDDARARGAKIWARAVSWSVGYEPTEEGELAESFEGAQAARGELGPASLPVALARALAAGEAGEARHRLRSRDGVVAESSWRWP